MRHGKKRKCWGLPTLDAGKGDLSNLSAAFDRLLRSSRLTATLRQCAYEKVPDKPAARPVGKSESCNCKQPLFVGRGGVDEAAAGSRSQAEDEGVRVGGEGLEDV
jgi:hypothetical protein